MDLDWRKSSHSGSNTDEVCVELAWAMYGVAVRDSKNPTKGWLELTPTQFTRLAEGIK